MPKPKAIRIQPLFEETEDAVKPSASGSEEGGTPVDIAPPVTDDGVGPGPLIALDDLPAPAPEPPVPIVEEEPPVEPEPADIPVQGDMTRDEMVANLNRILGAQGKRGLPTDVEFLRKSSNVYAHVIIDANDALLAEGWEFYKQHMPADSEEYLACVYDALQIGVPRLYRQVVKLRLT